MENDKKLFGKKCFELVMTHVDVSLVEPMDIKTMAISVTLGQHFLHPLCCLLMIAVLPTVLSTADSNNIHCAIYC